MRVAVRDPGDFQLAFIHRAWTPFVNGAGTVANDDVANADRNQQPRDRDAGRAGPVHHNAQIGEFVAAQSGRIDQCRDNHNGGAVLIVVEDRHVEPLAQFRFDFEAARRGNVFEIDATETRGDRFDDIHDFVDVGFGDTNRERFDPGERLEKDSLSFHHRQTGLRADVAETEHGSAIGHDGDEVALRRQFRHLGRIVANNLRRHERARRHAQGVEHVVIADRDIAPNFEHAGVLLAELDRLFLERGSLQARAHGCAPVFVDK